MNYFNLSSLQEISTSIFSHPFFKSIVAMFVYLGTFLFGTGDVFFSIAIPIILLLILDLNTRLMLSIRDKEVSFTVVSKSAMKLFVYSAYVIMGRIADHDLKGDWLTLMFKSFIIATECLAITETLGKLGFPLPTRFLKYFKSFTDEGKEIPKASPIK